jgi:hypothetical protein
MDLETQADTGLLSRIINVFFAPSLTFKAVRQRPSWLIPALIYVVISLGIMLVLRPVVQKEQAREIETRMMDRGMSQQQIDQTIEQTQSMTKYFMYPAVIVGPFVVFVIGAAIWLFVSKTILGSQVTFKQMLGVVVYKSYILLLGSLIKLPIMLSRETVQVHFSPATFMSDSMSEGFIYQFLSKLDLFNIWSIAVLCIGIAVVAEKDIKRVWPWVVLLYAVWYLITSALGGIMG